MERQLPDGTGGGAVAAAPTMQDAQRIDAALQDQAHALAGAAVAPVLPPLPPLLEPDMGDLRELLVQLRERALTPPATRAPPR